MEQATSNSLTPAEQTITVGRYVLHREIARGGMATIHFGRLLGDEGFSRIVAVKRLHAELAQDAQFVAMFLDEARIASRVQHRNVVPVLDVVAVGQEVILVQEYVHGVPLDLLLTTLRQREQRLPIELAVAITCQLLAGLQATHDTTDELGQPMHIVHRDVSPQNVMIALDGSARLLDFGIATSGIAAQEAREGMYKGKFAYSAPEQLQRAATPQSDIYSASILLWELLVGERIHGGKKGAELVSVVLSGTLPRMSEALAASGRWDALDAAERAQLLALEPIVERGFCLDTSVRWATAREMEDALAARVRPAPARVLAEWARMTGQGFLLRRASILAAEEEGWRRLHPFDSTRPSDPGSLGVVRTMRISNPPDAPTLPAPANVKRAAARKLALAAGCGVALLFALALNARLSPPGAAEAKKPNERPRAAEQPVAAQAPAAAPAQPAATSEQAARAPLALPTRAAASEPLKVGARAHPRAEDVTEPAQRLAPVVEVPVDGAASDLRSTRGPAKDLAAPAVAPAGLPSDECEVPYYFEGKKKIFKSACI